MVIKDLSAPLNPSLHSLSPLQHPIIVDLLSLMEMNTSLQLIQALLYTPLLSSRGTTLQQAHTFGPQMYPREAVHTQPRCILLMMQPVILMAMYGPYHTATEFWSSGPFQPMEIGLVKEPILIQEATTQWV